MESVKFYPTANFRDCFGIFSNLLSFQKHFKIFKIRFHKRDRYDKSFTCDFSGLVELLSSLEYEKYSDVAVLGYPTEEQIDSELLFCIYYDYCTGNHCLRFYYY